MTATEIDLNELASMLENIREAGQTALLPMLHQTQELYGYIPAPAMQLIGEMLGVSTSTIEQVVDYYPLFYRQPAGKTVVHVCNNPVCANAGAEAVMKRLSQSLESRRESGEPVGTLTIEYAACLGLCEHAPAMIVQGTSVARADSISYDDLVTGKLRHPRSIVRNEVAILTGNCGKNRVNWLNLYRAASGYKGLEKALKMTPVKVIEEIQASGLRGRGGAAFPTGEKWKMVANAGAEEKYVICNADEAEPGSFKDRVLMEDEPHSILEGMLIAGYAIGAQKGYIYVRGEYVFQYQVLLHAVEEARHAGLLGKDILGSGFCFDIAVRRGAGTYVAGEETAQIESIEGKRAIPRERPPYPAISGLFGKPTLMNNVETIANVPYILRNGAAQYRQIGTPHSPGPKLFCLSGDVEMPGIYEVPFGVTFRHLLIDLAGGVRGGREMKAALFGGASGAFATPDHLDVPLSFEGLSSAGLPVGAGVITVFDDTRDLRDVCLRQARFLADESCGKCAACQTGTQRQYEILQRAAGNFLNPDDVSKLVDTAWTHPQQSICGLGQTAANPILSAINHWPQLFVRQPN